MSINLTNTTTIFTKSFPDFGTIHIRPFNIQSDIKMLHSWVVLDYAIFWGMQNYTLKEVKEEYEIVLKSNHYDAFVGFYNNKPAFILERYSPEQDSIGNIYNVEKGDCGVHIIVAPPQEKIEHFTWYVFTTIMDFIFKEDEVKRILVEPDIRNKKMFALCQRIGFKLNRVVELPDKTAQLAFLERPVYERLKLIPHINKRSAMNTLDNIVTPQQSISHLKPNLWNKANRQLIKKAICEFNHELLIQPKIKTKLEEGFIYVLETDNSAIYYEFYGKPLALNHLWIDEFSIKKYNEEQPQALDAVLFIKEIKQQIGIEKTKLPIYLEEIISTLYGSAYKLQKGNPKALELVYADFQTIEQSMTEGHPGFVANNGRIGFDSSDYRAYAPEAGNSFPLLWVAGHKNKTVYESVDSLSYELLIVQELGIDVISTFNKIITDNGYNAEDYLFMPIHPWQWFNKLANVFSSEIAKGDIICLGYSPDQYFAQQSIRTLFNSSNPKKNYTKTSLSILNMGFMRGLPSYYLGTAPKMAIWLEQLLYTDSYIKETGFKMLGEIASISYENPYFKEFGTHNDYNKMIASLWRESPMALVEEQQQLMTMAAFLHIDQDGNALLPEIIKASGLSINQWLHDYFKAYLSPLLHCFYHFDLVFMPHGENIIMVMDSHVPKHILLKDITEEACVLSPDVKLPEDLKRMYTVVPEDVKLLSIFIDVFDGFFRFMSHILVEHANYQENYFWELVAECITNYQNRFPQYQSKFNKYNLFTPEFQLSCLNRLQLNNNMQMIDLEDPVALLQFVGKLKNPLATFKTVEQV